MKIAVYLTGENRVQDEILENFAAGADRAGDEVVIASVYGEMVPADVGVTFGTRKRQVRLADARWKMLQAHKRAGSRVVIIESGFMKPETYWSVGWDNINGRADFNNRNMSGDRFAALDIELAPWKTGGQYVLLCGQRPHGSGAINLGNYGAWEAETLRRIRDRGYVALIRPHPGVSKTPLSLERQLDGASVCVTWNTNAAVQAVMAGVPSIALDEGSVAWAVSGHTLDDLASPPRPANRVQWARDLAYAQWTVAEIGSGEAWDHLRS